MIKEIIVCVVLTSAIASFSAEIRTGCFSQIGKKNQRNEDRFIIATARNFSAVFDGHGGDLVSSFLQENIVAEFNTTFNEGQPTDIKTKFNNLFSSLDNKVRHLAAGSTASVAYIEVNNRESKAVLHTAHVGDSRIVLFDENGKVVFATRDHKPNREDECTRIEENDGIIVSFERSIGKKTITESCVYLHGAKLNMSRSIGDHCWNWNKKIISSQPEYNQVKLEGLYYLVIGSDGLFDVFDNEKIGETIINTREKKLSQIIKILIQQAVTKGSRDDITLIIEKIQTK